MYRTTANSTAGFVEFDDRGNARWLPHAPASSEETLIQVLDIGWMELAPEESIEVHRDGFEEIYRTGR